MLHVSAVSQEVLLRKEIIYSDLTGDQTFIVVELCGALEVETGVIIPRVHVGYPSDSQYFTSALTGFRRRLALEHECGSTEYRRARPR